MKNFLFALGHPAHFHLYKNTISELIKREHSVSIVISDKDILKNLLDNHRLKYFVIAEKKNKEGVIKKLFKLISSSFELNRIVRKLKPDLIIGCLTQIGIIGWWNKIPTIFNAEDDIDYTYLQAILVYPFIKHIVMPIPTNVSIFKKKKIGYDGYQKLSYLHPNWFVSDYKKIEYPENVFFILRVAKLKAYHDLNITGLSDEIILKIISVLKDRGRILITSERSLPRDVEKYIYKGKIEDIHHYLAFADMYIGDSQSMAVEAAILGTPGIRFNKFAGKISILEELEKKYELTTSIDSSEPEKLFKTIETMLNSNNLKQDYSNRRDKMLNEKIDVTKFFIWLIENYPKSILEMKNNPPIQYQIK